MKSFSCVDPTPIVDYCLAVMYRFAYSEREYLTSLAGEVRDMIGDNMPLTSSSCVVPDGGLESPPILQELCNALALRGEHSRLKRAASASDLGHWSISPLQPYQCGEQVLNIATLAPKVHLQAKVLKVLQCFRQPQNLAPILTTKAVTTLGSNFSQQILVTPFWFGELRVILGGSKVFIRMCWLKTVSGGWCTTYRMHELVKWPCIFGCEACDEITHYLECPILWQFATEQIGAEHSILVGERLCLSNPNVQKLKTLALCHFVYHSCKNDEVCALGLTHFCLHPNSAPPWPTVQSRASGFSKVGRHLVQ